MAYMKVFCTPHPTNDLVVARVVTGVDENRLNLAGTLVLPSHILEQILDSLVLGASQMQFSDGKLEVYFGPENEQQIA